MTESSQQQEEIRVRIAPSPTGDPHVGTAYIGLTNFLEGLDIPVDPNMIREPRSNPYFRSDDWDEQVEKWNEYKQSAA
jgi:hypothetical protein